MDGGWRTPSDESGREEVYLVPLPDASPRSLVSNEGGSDPVWARNTGELFYRNGDRFVFVTEPEDTRGFFVIRNWLDELRQRLAEMN